MVLRNATVNYGTGAPPIGPTEIVVEDGRNTLLKKVTGNLATTANRRAPPPIRSRLPAGGRRAMVVLVEQPLSRLARIPQR